MWSLHLVRSVRRVTTDVNDVRLGRRPERKTGIEPASLAWKARALPLSYSRVSERPDSNRRPQRPERCALTKLRHSPKAALAADVCYKLTNPIRPSR